MSEKGRQDPWLGPPRDAVEDVPSRGGDVWAREAIERIAVASLREQRAARRWGVFFKLAFLAYLLLVFFMVYRPGALSSDVASGRHTALVEVRGVIAADQGANADAIITGLRRAFENDKAEAVILRCNSPGGSPVQAGYVNDEIRRLRAEHADKKLYAVITDVCASGGYYIAAAADEIYADKASIVGSIGVLMDGFGFVGTLEKLGVERRLVTAGESKGFMDPFSPMNENDLRHVRSMLEDIHEQFVTVVREGRGDRLSESEPLFTGLTWTGERSLELGLIDGLGSSSHVAREVIGAERIVDYTYRPPVFERFADRIGAVLSERILTVFRGEIR